MCLYQLLHICLKTKCEWLRKLTVGLIIHEGSSIKTLSNKIDKILTTINVTVLAYGVQEWEEKTEELRATFKEINNLDALTSREIKRHVKELMEPRASLQCSTLLYFEAYVKKLIKTHRQLASMSLHHNFLAFHAYIPTAVYPDFCQKHSSLIINPMELGKKPPTKVDIPETPKVPQEILNTYGVPSYN